jgi:hypothetical protein
VLSDTDGAVGEMGEFPLSHKLWCVMFVGSYSLFKEQIDLCVGWGVLKKRLLKGITLEAFEDKSTFMINVTLSTRDGK